MTSWSLSTVRCYAFCMWHFPIRKHLDLSFIWGLHHVLWKDDRSGKKKNSTCSAVNFKENETLTNFKIEFAILSEILLTGKIFFYIHWVRTLCITYLPGLLKAGLANLIFLFFFFNNLSQLYLSKSSLWKRMIAWERGRAASAHGIIWGQTRRNLVRNVIVWIVVVTARFKQSCR